jgi:hypothetical protein
MVSLSRSAGSGTQVVAVIVCFVCPRVVIMAKTHLVMVNAPFLHAHDVQLSNAPENTMQQGYNGYGQYRKNGRTMVA